MNYEEIFIEEKTESINTIGITDNISENYLREICQEYANNYGGQLESQVMLDRSETSCENCEYFYDDNDGDKKFEHMGVCRLCSDNRALEDAEIPKTKNSESAWADGISEDGQFAHVILTVDKYKFGCKQFEPKLREGTT